MTAQYVCEVTGRKYKTARGAKNSAEREKLMEFQRNYFRLNATSVEHLVELMVEKGKEFWGWDLDVKLLQHGGSTTTANGKTLIKFSVYLKLTPGRRYNKHTLVGEYIVTHVSGLYGSFNWTSFRSQTRHINMAFSFDPNDFPLIKEKYIEYCRSVSDQNEWDKEKKVVDLEALRFSRKQEDYIMADKRVTTLEQQLDIARNTRNEIAKYFMRGYDKLWSDVVKKPVIDESLDRMFRKGA